MMEYSWENVEKIVSEIRNKKLDFNNSNIVLFGAGMNGSLAYQKLKVKYTVVGFSDNNSSRWGCTNEGLQIINPAELKNIENLLVVITVTGKPCKAISEQLDNLNLANLTYFELCISENFEQFNRVYNELLIDDFSKKTYRNIILGNLLQDESLLKEVFVKNQYFELPEFNLSTPKEVFVDCGAFAGDTMEAFIFNRAGTFKKMYCFEPTEKTYRAMNFRSERLIKEWALAERQIVLEQKVVGSENGSIFFADEINADKSNRMSNETDKKGQSITIVTLDSYFENIEDKPTFIKADIEGAEVDLINGAKSIIINHKPQLAICLYHCVDDLFEIPLLLKQLNPEYKMDIRHHMPNYYETVLYCY